MDINENDSGFAAARAAMEAEEQAPEVEQAAPKPVAEGEVAETPEPDAPEKEAAVPTVDSSKPSEFVDFTTPEQKKRFNDVFGYAKRLEREKAALEQQLNAIPRYQPQPVVQQAPVVPQPQGFTEPKPKLAEFEDADKWADAVSDWSARKAEFVVMQRTRQEYAVQQTQRQHQEQSNARLQMEEAKIREGHERFGQMEFDNLSNEIANFVTPVMRDTLFQLKAFPEVVVELGRNLQEADRISRLSPIDQIYELKALERRLLTANELKHKEQQLKPTKVEAPGQGEPPKTSPNLTKLRNAAIASGRLQDFAKLVEAANM